MELICFGLLMCRFVLCNKIRHWACKQNNPNVTFYSTFQRTCTSDKEDKTPCISAEEYLCYWVGSLFDSLIVEKLKLLCSHLRNFIEHISLWICGNIFFPKWFGYLHWAIQNSNMCCNSSGVENFTSMSNKNVNLNNFYFLIFWRVIV